MGKNDFKYLSQEFHSFQRFLNLIRQKGFYPYKYVSKLEKFKETLPRKEKFYSFLIDKTISDKDYEHVLIVWNKFERKTMTKGEFGLISDDETYLFFEKCVRSKVSYIYKICRKSKQ